MRTFAADLHVHTALSPCADPEMTPPAIVEEARRHGLEVIAICDHNAADNVAAVCGAAGGVPYVVPGIEITTAEEAHVLGLFPDAACAQAVGTVVGATLPRLSRPPKPYEEQRLMDAAGGTIALGLRMLSTATTLSVSETVAMIQDHGGLAVAAHVDRPSYSVMSQLGFFPEDAAFDAIEISAAGLSRGRQLAFARLGLSMVAGSDSHFLSELGTCGGGLCMNAPTFAELRLALGGRRGRGTRLA
ncbi:MAG TPA: PHP domain-containing protein [Candidatus Hydrogenedentes bacterium]|nr:PHP domain-containing protein [Candidatus Hydrogenedentota bacterium]HPG68607.1 PHP domain-containing protein [Candidatus Hydrogenedentota bacterium]